MVKNTKSTPDSSRQLRSNMIGFRLNNEQAQQTLMQRAEILGISPHDLARQYVIEALFAQEERHAVFEIMRKLLEHTIQLRGDVATASEALLLASGSYTEEEASDWCKQVFNK